ncbi:helix-turn-helix transcriptional regulator [Candidatus Parcubacteria bacterium]|nr:helix-turn-helix transcriptional regulator [Candidatus Parcubacteria bacterium]
MTASTIFKALGEPTRLKMVERLSLGGSHTITSLLQEFPISRQGGRKHLQILLDSKIIYMIPDGRNTLVTLDTKGLNVGKKFLEKLEIKWEKKLLALKDYVEGK